MQFKANYKDLVRGCSLPTMQVCNKLVTKEIIKKYSYACSDGKESICNAGDTDSILESGKFPGEGNGYPLQYSCLEKTMDRGAWRATVGKIAKSQTQQSD